LIRAFALALAALAAGAPPPSGAQERIRVVATSADLRSLVEAVGGDGVEVVSIAAPEQDPHAIEVKPGQLALLRRADLVVKVGLDHEPWLARFPKPAAPVLDVSRSVSLLQIETPRLRVERRAHVHAFGNTHYWLDPHNAAPMTAAILSALVARHPAGAAAFAANRDAFLARLSPRLTAWEALLEPYAGTRVVVVHDSWSYFAARFRLKIMAAAEPQPGVPPSPAELAALLKAMRDAQVRILIADPHSNPALVRQIGEKTGVRAVTLLPSGNDYIGLLEENVRRLAQALKPS
jgi:ABC-type Zn uptake system ZnuABC Zn-binding protein ZnuA